MAAQRLSQTQSAAGTQVWPTQPSAIASQRFGSGQRPIDFVRYIKLPQDQARLMAMILERPHPLTSEARAAKAQELVDLKAAILSSPDLNAWRQGISPEAYRNPTKFGGTDPRDPFNIPGSGLGYTKLPYFGIPNPTTAQVMEVWIGLNNPGLTYDRIAADGKVYTFRDNTPARSEDARRGKSYKTLIEEIENRYIQFTGGNRMPDAGKWPKPMGEEPGNLSETPARDDDLYTPGRAPLPGLPPR